MCRARSYRPFGNVNELSAGLIARTLGHWTRDELALFTHICLQNKLGKKFNVSSIRESCMRPSVCIRLCGNPLEYCNLFLRTFHFAGFALYIYSATCLLAIYCLDRQLQFRPNELSLCCVPISIATAIAEHRIYLCKLHSMAVR